MTFFIQSGKALFSPLTLFLVFYTLEKGKIETGSSHTCILPDLRCACAGHCTEEKKEKGGEREEDT